MLEILTTSPVCGAWTNWPPPMYMPMCPSPLKKTRSAGWRSSYATGDAVVPLRGRVVRQRDADLRVDVRGEARAVEPGRAHAAPDVRDAEVLERDRDDLRGPAPVRRRSGLDDRLRVHRGRERRLLLGLQRGELRAPGPARACAASSACRRCSACDHRGDLFLDRVVELLPVAELRLDRRLLRGPVGDDLRPAAAARPSASGDAPRPRPCTSSPRRGSARRASTRAGSPRASR